jgi:hypothetical protein
MRNVRFVTAVSAAVVLSLLSACGGGADDSSLGESDDSLTTRTPVFVTLRKDQRRCAAPACGGYWAKDANKTSAEQYVSALDFAAAHLDETSLEHVQNAPAEELLLKARLGPAERVTKTRTLLVSEAYRGLPGARVAAGDAFYTATKRSPQITCVAAPCNNLVGQKLGTSTKSAFTRLELAPAAPPLTQLSWLESRVLARGGIVAAHFEAGQRQAAGTEKVLEASQVFIRLPEAIGPCPQARMPPCADGQVRTFARDENRCVVPSACVTPGMCPLFLPNCGPGYSLQTWRAGTFACNVYQCDPMFTVPE